MLIDSVRVNLWCETLNLLNMLPVSISDSFHHHLSASQLVFFSPLFSVHRSIPPPPFVSGFLSCGRQDVSDDVCVASSSPPLAPHLDRAPSAVEYFLLSHTHPGASLPLYRRASYLFHHFFSFSHHFSVRLTVEEFVCSNHRKTNTINRIIHK